MPSGPLDLTDAQFETHYAEPLARAAADSTSRFVVGSAPRGADAMALTRLLQLGVAPDRIHVHLYLPPCTAKKAAKLAKQRAEHQAIHDAYTQRGLTVVTQNSTTGRTYESHEERDAALTRASHRDILWLRPDADTRALLGNAYREGRISGTQTNALRRTAFNSHNDNNGSSNIVSSSSSS
jgi:hypothetical protein